MVHVIETVEVAPGKEQEAREWARAANAYANKTFGGGEGVVLLPVTPGPGQGGSITFMIRFDSLAAWADAVEKESEDSGWQERIKTFQKLFIPSKLTRTLYRTI